MLYHDQLPWLREFLLKHCDNPSDHAEIRDILYTFQKLWKVARSARLNPYPRSPRLIEALKTVFDEKFL